MSQPSCCGQIIGATQTLCWNQQGPCVVNYSFAFSGVIRECCATPTGASPGESNISIASGDCQIVLPDFASSNCDEITAVSEVHVFVVDNPCRHLPMQPETIEYPIQVQFQFHKNRKIRFTTLPFGLSFGTDWAINPNMRIVDGCSAAQFEVKITREIMCGTRFLTVADGTWTAHCSCSARRECELQ